MPLSLHKVQELLREQETAMPRTTTSTNLPLMPLSQEQRESLLSRPLPPTLYKCPISEPSMTIVPYTSLPKRVKDKIDLDQSRIFVNDASTDDDDEDVMVEIPVAWMEAAVIEGEASLVADSLAGQRRQGNLRDKLTEYTRGSRLQQPFRPGGLGPGGGGGPTEEDIMDETSTSPETVERHNKVLHQDTAESWRQGLLMTAPPGVSFKVGIAWEDVYGQPLDTPAATTSNEMAEEAQEEEAHLVDEPHAIPSPRITSAPLFSKGYFDDDSLFGSSSDEEEEESDDDNDDGDDDHQAGSASRPTPAATATPQTDSTPLSSRTTTTGEAAIEDIDGLLAELTLDPMKGKTSHSDLAANPLELAERQARDQMNTTRKEWANTRYLPIRDFDALIPNPALEFPFTLDDFQQQAVARLERNEVRSRIVCLLNVDSSLYSLLTNFSLFLLRRTLLLGRLFARNTQLPWLCDDLLDVFTHLPSKPCRIKSFVTSASSSVPRMLAFSRVRSLNRSSICVVLSSFSYALFIAPTGDLVCQLFLQTYSTVLVDELLC